MRLRPRILASLRRVLLAFLLALTAGACGAQELLCETHDFPPFTYMKDGAPGGPAVEVLKAVFKDMGQPYKIDLVPWTRAQLDVKEGRAQVLFLVGMNPERALWLQPSLPILVTEYGVFVQESNPLVFKDVAQLKDYSVAVYGPSNTSATLESFKERVPGMTIDMTLTDEPAFRKLDAGRVKAVFSNKDVGMAKLKQLGLKRIRYAGMQSSLKYFMGFSQTKVPKATVDKFNEAYRKLYRSGEIKKILKAYDQEPAALE